MKKLTIAATLTAGVLLLSACSPEEDTKSGSDEATSDSAVVVESKVGDITKDDFYNEMKNYIGESALYNMVVIRVLEDKYEVSDEEVDEAVQEAKDAQGDMFSMWLMQQGYPDEDAFREQTYQRLLQEKLMFEDVEISDAQIEEKFNEMKENNELQIRASHILIQENEETSAEEAEALVQEVQQKLDEGADFAELAKEYSTDGSAANGGDLGYFGTGKMVKEFEEAAFALGEDEVSGPVKSEFGTHFIKVTDVPTLDEKKEEIRRQLAMEEIDYTAVQEKMDKLIEDAKIDVKIEEFKDLFVKPEAQG
ncbi:peptidylprolyl isomerase [Ornithinibacillus californiensis]|uniref:peptidylprolyl isomerase n=1 Tax=Ornithinibacillus californiensis TaxID=161536 RepID=UPI00064E054F|nr:peptidylprolyl isomerase [Ornithinibacillus californiensis]